ncbi:glycoside hydrolase superfamily [Fusarium avenaceum]|nr:glycoside hydrolase superfamily [Fusarium avenaceum]
MARKWSCRNLATFNQTAHFEQLGKRFELQLADRITKIRDINFGGWLICEPWLQYNEWQNNLQCSDSLSEFNCMRDHCSRARLEEGNQLQKASNLGIYIIIDLHAAPGGQQEDVFTGQNAKPAGFFNQHNFGRAKKWLAWITDCIHTNPIYYSMGIIEVLNEPVSRHDKDNRYPTPGQDPGLIYQFYPAALRAVSDTEAMLNVSDDQKLHVQFICSKWDSGDPLSISAIGFALGDQKGDPYQLLHSACTDDRVVQGQDFTITGEWSMTSDYDWGDKEFFQRLFTAQQQLYEKPPQASS